MKQCWKTYKLGELVKVKGGKRLPKGISLQIAPNTHPYIRIRDMGKCRVLELDATYEYVDDVTQKSIARYVVDEGDILLSIVGTIGLVGIVGKSLHQANQTENCVKLVNLNGIDPLFLYYFLLSPKGQEEIKRGTVGAVQAKLPIKNIENIEISLPPLEEQRRIAGILGAIDDKIENNRRINTNLELQAQALYKQWFVDNRSDDWEEIKLGDIIEISKKSITPSQFENTIFEHYSLPAYDDGKQPTFDRGQDIKSSKFVINNGMFLFSKLNPYIKRIWFPNIGTEHAICSTEFIPYKPKRVDMLGLCYSIVNSEHFYDYVLSLTNGSTGSHQRFHPVDTLEYPLCIPSEKYIEKFESLVMPMYKEIALNRKENRRLATLRDTLLPKLMNGEIKL